MTLAGGVYGQWYYNGPNAPQLKGANAKAFGRATTTSLGSVAFGSLIVTVLEVLKQVLNAVSRNERAEGDGEGHFALLVIARFACADSYLLLPVAVGAALACLAACCVGCVSNLIQYFNSQYNSDCCPVVPVLISVRMIQNTPSKLKQGTLISYAVLTTD